MSKRILATLTAGFALMATGLVATSANATAYSRALDRGGNRESRFVRGRNANTFEVR
jgi:hypothetical protein